MLRRKPQHLSVPERRRSLPSVLQPGCHELAPLYNGDRIHALCQLRLQPGRLGQLGPSVRQDWVTALPNMQAGASTLNGVIFQMSNVWDFTAITDGTSNTILLGEWPYGKLNSGDQSQCHWCTGPATRSGDAGFANAVRDQSRKGNAHERNAENNGIDSLCRSTVPRGALAPAGRTFIFCDGSVNIPQGLRSTRRPIIRPTAPSPTSRGAAPISRFSIPIGTAGYAPLGVYQALVDSGRW